MTNKESFSDDRFDAGNCDGRLLQHRSDDVALVANNLHALLHSNSYRLAHEDKELLATHDMRGVRMLLEISKPEMVLEAEQVESTILVFGGACLVEKVAAERKLFMAESRLRETPDDPQLKRQFQRAQRLVQLSHFYDAAREFANLVSCRHLYGNGPMPVIATGGGPGIMEAANRGASLVPGGKSVGLGISLPFEAGVNEFTPEELAFEFHYFFMRKLWFLYLAKTVIVFPGGFGTLDEMFETLTLRQTGKIDRPLPTFLYGREFWDKCLNLDAMVEAGTISPGDPDLFTVVDSVDEAFALIVRELEALEATPTPTEG